MKEARARGVDRGFEALPEQPVDRLQAAVALLREDAGEPHGGLIPTGAATRGQVIDAGQIAASRIGHPGQQEIEVVVLQRVGHA